MRRLIIIIVCVLTLAGCGGVDEALSEAGRQLQASVEAELGLPRTPTPLPTLTPPPSEPTLTSPPTYTPPEAVEGTGKIPTPALVIESVFVVLDEGDISAACITTRIKEFPGFTLISGGNNWTLSYWARDENGFENKHQHINGTAGLCWKLQQ